MHSGWCTLGTLETCLWRERLTTSEQTTVEGSWEIQDKQTSNCSQIDRNKNSYSFVSTYVPFKSSYSNPTGSSCSCEANKMPTAYVARKQRSSYLEHWMKAELFKTCNFWDVLLCTEPKMKIQCRILSTTDVEPVIHCCFSEHMKQ